MLWAQYHLYHYLPALVLLYRRAFQNLIKKPVDRNSLNTVAVRIVGGYIDAGAGVYRPTSTSYNELLFREMSCWRDCFDDIFHILMQCKYGIQFGYMKDTVD